MTHLPKLIPKIEVRSNEVSARVVVGEPTARTRAVREVVGETNRGGFGPVSIWALAVAIPVTDNRVSLANVAGSMMTALCS